LSRDEAAGLNQAACLTAYVSAVKAGITKKGVCGQEGGSAENVA